MRSHSGYRDRSLVAWFAIVAVALMVLLSACGGPTAEQKKAAAAASASAAAKAKAEKQRAAEKAAYDKCRHQIGATMSASKALNTRLSVGMIFADYTKTVGEVKVKLDKIETLVQRKPMPLSPKCLAVAAKLESAINKWADALEQWNDCIGEFDCDIDTGTHHDAMQADWTRASTLMDQATTKLSRMKPKAPPVGSA